MSMELHIIRIPESFENRISAEEWLECISEDADLQRKEADDIPGNWIVATVSGTEEWEVLRWSNGSISAKYPQSRMTAKMLDLSERLSAALMTDDGIIFKRGKDGGIACDEH